MTTDGAFEVTAEHKFANSAQMLYAVTEHYAALGFKGFKIVDSGDGDGGRITATTPGGRGGRNVAFFDWDRIRAKEHVLSHIAMHPSDGSGVDDDFYEGYTPEQIAWCEEHGEAIDMERMIRYCDEETGECRAE